jgi:predicted enzyme related to lactoylglutathione lyase
MLQLAAVSRRMAVRGANSVAAPSGRSSLPERSSRDITPPRREKGFRPALAVGVGLLIGGLAAGVASAADVGQLVPLNVPASTEHHAGKHVFAELVTPDLAAAKKFYAGLFGWTFQDYVQRDAMFSQAMINGQVVGGIYQRPLPAGRRPGWIGFIATSDLAKAESLATQNGAKVLLSARPFANLGQEAVLADPQGAVFGVLDSSSGDPPDAMAGPGEWIWSSLITTDPAADAAFYKVVFGYEVYDLPDVQDKQHLILASDRFARASVNPMPPSWTGAKPRWLNFIHVDDASAMCAEVTTLGGKVVQAPHMDRHGGKIAVVADPAGALFGLMEWPDDTAPGAAK